MKSLCKDKSLQRKSATNTRKITMQKLLAADYLLGREPNNENEFNYVLAALTKAAPSYLQTYEKGTNRSQDELSWACELIDDSIYNTEFHDMVMQDETLRCAVCQVSNFQKRSNERRNYIVSKNLSEILQKVPPNVKVSFLPNKFIGYFEIPNLLEVEGERIAYIICTIDTVENEKILHAYYQIENSGMMGHVSYLFSNQNIRVVDALSHDPVNSKVFNTTFEGRFETSTDKVPVWVTTLCNAIVYATSSDREFKEEINQFATKKKKLETQQKIYTQLPFINLDSDTIKVNLTQTGEFQVRGHFRWQPCGPNKEQHKLIFIDEFTKGGNQ